MGRIYRNREWTAGKNSGTQVWPLDISLKRFANMTDLNAYVIRLKQESDLPKDAVDNFYRSYKEKFLNL